jgi:peptide deformylase
VGCLSFLDVRSQLPRPPSIQVEYSHIDDHHHITQFDHGTARVVAHEIDHLDDHLYLERMPAGTEPIPVEQYRGTSTAWQYPGADQA